MYAFAANSIHYTPASPGRRSPRFTSQSCGQPATPQYNAGRSQHAAKRRESGARNTLDDLDQKPDVDLQYRGESGSAAERAKSMLGSTDLDDLTPPKEVCDSRNAIAEISRLRKENDDLSKKLQVALRKAAIYREGKDDQAAIAAEGKRYATIAAGSAAGNIVKRGIDTSIDKMADAAGPEGQIIKYTYDAAKVPAEIVNRKIYDAPAESGGRRLPTRLRLLRQRQDSSPLLAAPRAKNRRKPQPR